MLKRVAVLLMCLSLLACGSEQADGPAQAPQTTKVNDPGKDITNQALVLAFDKDFDKAAPLFEQAAEQGNRTAMYFIGLLYARGEGVKQDFNQAFQWLHKSAMGGHPKAIYHLGEMYVKGDGVEVNHVTALAWFWVGTTMGDRFAEKRLRAVTPRLNDIEVGDAKLLSEKLYRTIPHDLKIDRFSMH